MSWYLNAFKNYATFSGRARRKEFWMFHLFNVIFTGILLFVLYVMLYIFSQNSNAIDIQNIVILIPKIIYIYLIIIILPSISITVRRLNDQNKSWVWFLISFIPLIGGIWMLVLMCTAGTAGSNQYGDDPKG